MAKLNNGVAWAGSSNQTESSKTYTFETKDKYLDKNIEFTVNADIVKAVDYTPTSSTSKDTSIIYSNTSGKYYLWR